MSFLLMIKESLMHSISFQVFSWQLLNGTLFFLATYCLTKPNTSTPEYYLSMGVMVVAFSLMGLLQAGLLHALKERMFSEDYDFSPNVIEGSKYFGIRVLVIFAMFFFAYHWILPLLDTLLGNFLTLNVLDVATVSLPILILHVLLLGWFLFGPCSVVAFDDNLLTSFKLSMRIVKENPLKTLALLAEMLVLLMIFFLVLVITYEYNVANEFTPLKIMVFALVWGVGSCSALQFFAYHSPQIDGHEEED